MVLSRFTTGAALVAALASTVSATCESFGIDYQNGGTYFQNIDLNQTFTALQQFSGCANDTAHNVLVDPNGDQSECSQTPLTPDNTPQQVVCEQWTDPEMYSGDWSLLIVSNNGKDAPIAYQRDFYLEVGKPNVTITDQSTATSTIVQTTIVSNIETATTTYTPLPTLNADNKAIGNTFTGSDGTVTATSYFYETAVETITETGSCTNKIAERAAPTSTSHLIQYTLSLHPSISINPEGAIETILSVAPRAAATTTSHLIDYTIHLHPTLTLNPDKIIQIVPTVLGSLNKLAESIACEAGLDDVLKPIETAVPLSAKFKRDVIAGRRPSEEVRRAFVEERAARRREKRGPDSFTTTVYSGEAATTEVATRYITVTRQRTEVVSVAAATQENALVTGTSSLPTITEYKPYTIYSTTTSTMGVYTCDYA